MASAYVDSSREWVNAVVEQMNRRDRSMKWTGASGLAVWCGLALSGCLSPGDIDNPEQFLAKIGTSKRDGGAGDAAVGSSGRGGSGGTGASSGGSSGSSGSGSMDDGCAEVVSELMMTCVASVCHGNDSASALKLEDPGLPGRLSGVKSSSTCKELPYVDPDEPEKSLLLTKMTMKPPCGSPMPLGMKVPTEAQRACVLQWITDGLGGEDPPPSGMDGGMMPPTEDAGCTKGDTDKDGTDDCDDECINDPDKTKPGMCGCGKPDEDSDDDGALDCEDDCPDDPTKMMPPCSGPKPGLLVGTLTGAAATGANPGNSGIDPLGPTVTEKIDSPNNQTIVLTGQIHISSSGVASFYEDYDDRVRLFVDGMMILSNDFWDEPTAGVIMRPEGWYDFELRLGNGSEASGPSAKMGIGFGYSPMNRNGSMNEADYVLPRNMNATTANLFRTDEP